MDRLRLLLALGALVASPAAAQDTTRASADDGWPDISKFLDKPYGFAPILIPVTEPAVGYGIGGALIFIDKRRDGAVDMRHPTITGIGGFWTEDGSWGVAGGHVGYAFDTRVKWRVGGIYTNVFLGFYGLSDESPFNDSPVNYELKATGGLVGGLYQFGNSGFWIGADYLLSSIDVAITLPAPVPPEIGQLDSTTTLAALRPSFAFDSRDNVFSPLRGFYAEASASLFGKAVGSQTSFSKVGLVTLSYFPLRQNLYFGLKAEGSISTDDTPFYLKPYVGLRGVAAQRVQGKQVADAEAELRWQFWNRFSAVGFAGVGGAWSGTAGGDKHSSVVSGGGGFRYEIARKYGLHMGADVGFGPDDPVLYVQFGSAWARP